MTQSEALTILKTGANVFLTGEPGSGKTYTINEFTRYLRAHGIEPSITASTGIAATHVGGMTIHSWSGIGARDDLSEYDLDHIAQNERVVKRLRAAHILIIDEISMLAANTLSMVDAVCRTVRGANLSFGGLQVVLVGDFFQLPPVVRTPFRAQRGFFAESEGSPSPFSFNANSWEVLNPIVCYLSEQHRQEDPVFLDILSAIRRARVSASHRQTLLSRKGNPPPGATNLFAHNADVDRVNDAALGEIEGAAHIFHMTSQGSANMAETLKRGCLSPETLSLKIGARVMFTKNDTNHRYVNGTLGTVTSFVKGSDQPVVKTTDGREIIAESAEWRIEEGGKTLAKINQIPLRLAWAITVHKSQGMSLDAAHMDLSRAFEYGQGYVAISRVRTLSGLSLAGINERALEVHPEIRAKDEYFRASSDVAREKFTQVSKEEMEQLHRNFITACGGTWAPKRAEAAVDAPDAQRSKLEDLRANHPNAYRPWSEEEEGDLIKRFENGEPPSRIAKALGRKPGAIHMRLIKLGLIEE